MTAKPAAAAPATAPFPDLNSAREAWGLLPSGLGLSLGGAHGPGHVDRQQGWVSLAERLGMHSVWLPEMHFAPGVCPAPLIELAGFAAQTQNLRFGTTSLLLPLHPPEEIAAEIAALDQISKGRLLIGLGRGFQKKMLAAFEVPPAEKRDRFDEALDRILALWAEGQAQGTALAPLQKPHPPLAVAAFGPKGLAQSARRGLPYLASPVETFDQIADNQERHRADLPDPKIPALSLVMRTVFVSEDERELDRVRDALAAEMNGRRAGMPKAVNQALDAPLSERMVVGNAEAVTEQLRRERARLGLDLLIVRPQISGIDQAVLEGSLSRLAEEIWPTVVNA
ncbi:MAG: LLM class flavin-dependent oxidoreductase [Myxococcota bacterium]